MVAETVRTALEERGIDFELSSHDETFTAQETAAATHHSGYEVAKPVFLDAGGELVMAVIPAVFQIDLEKAKYALGTEEVRLARESQFDPAFPDCERGAEPALGTLYDVATILDERLTSDTITFDSGSHSEVVSMKRSDYLDIVHPKMADLAAEQ